MSNTILIVDDSESIRSILKLTLKFKGYNVIEAENGLEAFEILKKTQCDLVITDIAMPTMTGIELLNKIRNELKNDKIPIIICTAEKIGDEEELLRKGANKLLVKPFPPTELLEVVQNLLK